MDISDKLNDLKAKAQDAATEHKDEIREAIHKAQDAADQQTGGKYQEQIGKAGAKAEEYLEKLTAERGEQAGPSPAPDTPPSGEQP